MRIQYTTKQVADMLSIDKSTLLRWIRQEKIPDVIHRDGRNWRVWLQEDVDRVKLYHDKIHQLTLNLDEDKALAGKATEPEEKELPL